MITIDGITYDVNIKIINRSAVALDKYAERTENGVLQRELIGWYFNFDVECGMSIHNVDDYADLFLKLTEPVEFHTVTMPAPAGFETFECYFASVKDQATTWEEDGTEYFRNLSFSVIARSPARTP